MPAKRSKSATVAVGDTKAYCTNYISTDALVKTLRIYLRDQLKIDDELEDAKIKLVASKDFYLRQAYEAIDTPEKLNDFVKS